MLLEHYYNYLLLVQNFGMYFKFSKTRHFCKEKLSVSVHQKSALHAA